MRRFVQAAVALCGVLAMAVPALASSATPVAGEIHVYSTPSGNGGTILVTGAIGDYGKTLTVDKSGKPTSNGDFVRVTLQQGSFLVDKTALNQKSNSTTPSLDKATCSGELSASAPVTLSHGTGRYAGISGTVDVTISFAFVGTRYKSGASKGKCNVSNNAPFASQWGAVIGSGSVTFG